MVQLAQTLTRAIAGGLARTWRIEVVGDDGVAALRRAGRPVLFAVWHGQLLAPLWHRRQEGITLLISGHRDGRRLAGAARGWGYRVVHGSTSRGALIGLRRLVRALREGGDAALTPDGPRGPARVAKAGAVVAARRSGAVIVPVATAASSAWQAASWDGFMVPRPFARVRIVYGVAVDMEDTPTDRARERLTAALDRAQDLARQ